MLHFPRWKTFSILGACLFFMIVALPNFLTPELRKDLPSWMPGNTVNLGLDLRGGSHLLLEVDFASYKREQMTNLVDEVRTQLRKERIGYRGLSAHDGALSFELRDEPTQDISAFLHKIEPELDVSTSDTRKYEATYSEKWETKARQQILEQSLEIVGRRVNETGTKEPIIQRQGLSRILLQVPGLDNPEHLKKLLGKTAKMTFHMVDENVSPQDLEQGIVPAGVNIIPADEHERRNGWLPKYAIQSRVMLSGDMLVDAHASFDQDGSPVVSFRFNATGARKFGEITAANVGKPFAIVLDNKVITAPVIRSPILGGSGIISGNFTVETANDLALLLRAGALPAPLTIIEERSVGPSLGSDSIAAGKLASGIGVVMVVVFMLLFYGLFGLFANVAMLINAIMILGMLSLFEATLTLPGIAGIVLTIGMAVDANVLIFERMREEMRNGKTPLASVESGFKMAFGTIVDSNITTLVAALILYYFGTGTVKGFAVTLAIGILCSMFTAILVTRLMVAKWMLSKRPKALPI